jgi:hypothetical protein
MEAEERRYRSRCARDGWVPNPTADRTEFRAENDNDEPNERGYDGDGGYNSRPRADESPRVHAR